jgi:hypothetical protein
MALLDLERPRRAQSDVRIETVEVTPNIAAAWLDKNKNNRRKNARYVDQFARDMAGGAWRLTADSIKFDIHGNLIDGQHRLTACVKSGVPFRTVVAYGVEPSAQDVVDTGKARSLGDMLSLHEVTNHNHVAATYKLLINEKHDRAKFGGSSSVTHAETIKAYRKHPKLPLFVPQPGSMPRGFSCSHVGLINYVASTILNKQERAAAMFTVLKTGAPDYDGDPIHRFREKIIRAAADRTTLSQQARYFTLKMCWNAFARKRVITSVRWQADETPIDGLDLTKL